MDTHSATVEGHNHISKMGAVLPDFFRVLVTIPLVHMLVRKVTQSIYSIRFNNQKRVKCDFFIRCIIIARNLTKIEFTVT